MQIQNSVALVTGANRGIGRAVVDALLGAGAKKVYAAAHNVETLDRTFAFDQTRVAPLKLDVTNASSVAAAAQKGQDVTLLLNNAGVLDFGDILSTPLDKIERNFGTNFYGKLAIAR